MRLPRTPARRELAAIRCELDGLKATLRAVALAAAEDLEAPDPRPARQRIEAPGLRLVRGG